MVPYRWHTSESLGTVIEHIDCIPCADIHGEDELQGGDKLIQRKW